MSDEELKRLRAIVDKVIPTRVAGGSDPQQRKAYPAPGRGQLDPRRDGAQGKAGEGVAPPPPGAPGEPRGEPRAPLSAWAMCVSGMRRPYSDTEFAEFFSRLYAAALEKVRAGPRPEALGPAATAKPLAAVRGLGDGRAREGAPRVAVLLFSSQASAEFSATFRQHFTEQGQRLDLGLPCHERDLWLSRVPRGTPLGLVQRACDGTLRAAWARRAREGRASALPAPYRDLGEAPFCAVVSPACPAFLADAARYLPEGERPPASREGEVAVLARRAAAEGQPVLQFFSEGASEFAYEVLSEGGRELAARVKALALGVQTRQSVDPTSIRVLPYDPQTQLGERDAFAIEVARPDFAQPYLDAQHTVVLAGMPPGVSEEEVREACGAYGALKKLRLGERSGRATAHATFRFMSAVYALRADLRAGVVKISGVAAHEGEGRAPSRAGGPAGPGGSPGGAPRGPREGERDSWRGADRGPPKRRPDWE